MYGLPNDDLSIQNAIVVNKSNRYPLLIDPQMQGKTWIKNMELENKLVITNFNSKMFLRDLEECLASGTPLLIEDISEEIDPALDNILKKNYVKIGTSLKVLIDFKLFNTI